MNYYFKNNTLFIVLEINAQRFFNNIGHFISTKESMILRNFLALFISCKQERYLSNA